MMRRLADVWWAARRKLRSPKDTIPLGWGGGGSVTRCACEISNQDYITFVQREEKNKVAVNNNTLQADAHSNIPSQTDMETHSRICVAHWNPKEHHNAEVTSTFASLIFTVEINPCLHTVGTLMVTDAVSMQTDTVNADGLGWRVLRAKRWLSRFPGTDE